MIKAVIFDNEGVVVEHDWDRVARAAATAFSLPLKTGSAFKDSLQLPTSQGNTLLHEYGCGKISSDFYWSAVLESYKLPPTAENKVRMSSTLEFLTTDVNEESLHGVTWLQERGYLIFLLSNTTPEIIKGTKTRMDYFSLFDACYFSYEMGCRKPSPRAYLRVSEENSLLPSECLCIDDTLENVLAARRVGMIAEQYTLGRNQSLAEILLRHLPFP